VQAAAFGIDAVSDHEQDMAARGQSSSGAVLHILSQPGMQVTHLAKTIDKSCQATGRDDISCSDPLPQPCGSNHP
jgi:hypothetical protein